MKRIFAYAIAAMASVFFLFPYLWMLVSSFRTTAAVLRDPLRWRSERFDFSGFASILQMDDLSLLRATINSLAITGASTLLAVLATALGAYAMTRCPRSQSGLAGSDAGATRARGGIAHQRGT
jgi:ABC-type glycerol-3-phosphate transport system permease component